MQGVSLGVPLQIGSRSVRRVCCRPVATGSGRPR